VRLIAPAGELGTLATPHTAAGPALRELLIGSEGVFGVIPDVTVRVRPAPRLRRYEAWMAESFEAGTEIVRALAQGPGLPDVIRISDEEETEVSLALSGPRGLAGHDPPQGGMPALVLPAPTPRAGRAQLPMAPGVSQSYPTETDPPIPNTLPMRTAPSDRFKGRKEAGS